MSDDDDLTELTSRLANLKPSAATTTTTSTTSAPPPPTDDDLSARFTKLFSRPTVGASALPKQEPTPTNPEDGKSTAELVSAVGDAEEPFEIGVLNNEEMIKWLLEAGIPVRGGPLSDGGGKGEETGEVPEWLGRDTMGEVGTSTDEEEEEILRRVKDEMEWERKHGIRTPEREGGKEGEEEGEEDDDDAEFARLAARLSSLSPAAKAATVELPAVPKAAPGFKAAAAAAPKNEEGVSEVDTWCGICNDDAEYRCSGCDGDLYCGECLFDAHTGPEAGYEERRHKWTKYVRPRKVVAA